MPGFPAPHFPQVRGQGWFQTPSDQALPPAAVGKAGSSPVGAGAGGALIFFFLVGEERLSPVTAGGYSFQEKDNGDRSQRPRKPSRGPSQKEGLLYHSSHWRKSKLAEVAWGSDYLFDRCFSSFQNYTCSREWIVSGGHWRGEGGPGIGVRGLQVRGCKLSHTEVALSSCSGRRATLAGDRCEPQRLPQRWSFCTLRKG